MIENGENCENEIEYVENNENNEYTENSENNENDIHGENDTNVIRDAVDDSLSKIDNKQMDNEATNKKSDVDINIEQNNVDDSIAINEETNVENDCVDTNKENDCVDTNKENDLEEENMKSSSNKKIVKRRGRKAKKGRKRTIKKEIESNDETKVTKKRGRRPGQKKIIKEDNLNEDVVASEDETMKTKQNGESEDKNIEQASQDDVTKRRGRKKNTEVIRRGRKKSVTQQNESESSKENEKYVEKRGRKRRVTNLGTLLEKRTRKNKTKTKPENKKIISKKDKINYFLSKDQFQILYPENRKFKNKKHAIESLLPYHIFDNDAFDDAQFRAAVGDGNIKIEEKSNVLQQKFEDVIKRYKESKSKYFESTLTCDNIVLDILKIEELKYFVYRAQKKIESESVYGNKQVKIKLKYEKRDESKIRLAIDNDYIKYAKG
ncbi:hypothetical protein BDAP_000464 [Binucleata daphniae]